MFFGIIWRKILFCQLSERQAEPSKETLEQDIFPLYQLNVPILFFWSLLIVIVAVFWTESFQASFGRCRDIDQILDFSGCIQPTCVVLVVVEQEQHGVFHDEFLSMISYICIGPCSTLLHVDFTNFSVVFPLPQTNKKVAKCNRNTEIYFLEMLVRQSP